MTNVNGNAEFRLRVFKRRAPGKQEERYTIGVWEDDVLLAICDDACLDSALVALRREMERDRGDLVVLAPNTREISQKDFSESKQGAGIGNHTGRAPRLPVSRVTGDPDQWTNSAVAAIASPIAPSTMPDCQNRRRPESSVIEVTTSATSRKTSPRSKRSARRRS